MQDVLLGQDDPLCPACSILQLSSVAQGKEKADSFKCLIVRIGKILPCSELLEEIFLSCALPFVVGPYLALSHIKPAPCDLAV